ncbi:hypothetical protein ES708_29564 [subsurface metagenome]
MDIQIDVRIRLGSTSSLRVNDRIGDINCRGTPCGIPLAGKKSHAHRVRCGSDSRFDRMEGVVYPCHRFNHTGVFYNLRYPLDYFRSDSASEHPQIFRRDRFHTQGVYEYQR